jgi:transcriptional regulator with XRE-family HTH domain
MSIPKNATYSMIVTQLLEHERKAAKITQGEFFKSTGISQSTWSRINRGMAHLSLEEMRSACRTLNMKMDSLMNDADRASQLLPENEGIKILDNVKGGESKSILPTIIAGAALGYLVFRLLKK